MADVGAIVIRSFVWMLDFKFLVGTLLGWRFVTQVGGACMRPWGPGLPAPYAP
jgi:hypothetical protein